MSNPEDDHKPKYMQLQGKTQYEMAQSIDAAFAVAEQSVEQQAELAALQWWYQQLELQVQEEFHLADKALPKGDIIHQASFLQACKQLIHDALDLPHEDDGARRQTLQTFIERSLLDVIDMMQAKHIWRFDLQRMLQTLQGRLNHECQSHKRSPQT